MAKSIYDYWFVQFDFPNTKGKPYKSSGGKMAWNEKLKREIPEKWSDGELKDIANITMGQSPPGESYNELGEGVIFYQGCTDFGSRFPTVRQFTTQPSRYAKKKDILLSVRAPVGAMNISIEDCCIGRGLAALNSKNNCNPYLFEVIRNLKQVFDRRNTDGTTFGAITKDDLFSLKVVKPQNEVLASFSGILNPVFEKQNMIALENQQLASLRDWLLPMLMNGQVTVK
jgi:type I restriction enzyme, S subunit